MPTLRDVLNTLYHRQVASVPVLDDDHHLLGRCRIEDLEREIVDEMDLVKDLSGVWHSVIARARPMSVSELEEHPKALGVLALTAREGVLAISKDEIVAANADRKVALHEAILEDLPVAMALVSPNGHTTFGNSRFRRWIERWAALEWTQAVNQVLDGFDSVSGSYDGHASLGEQTYRLQAGLTEDDKSAGRNFIIVISPEPDQLGTQPDSAPEPEIAHSDDDDDLRDALRRGDFSLEQHLDATEKHVIQITLAMLDGDAQLAARLLGLSPEELQKKLNPVRIDEKT